MSSFNEKGKNFSCNNTKGLRKKSDFYETPYSITKQFLNNCPGILENDTILEPAMGEGAIVKVLLKYKRESTQIVSYDKEVDFLKEKNQYPCIITNPPFSLAKEFILKAKEVSSNMFAFLLPLSYLHGKERYDVIYSDKVFPLSEVYIFTRYPMLGEPLREDGKYHTGMMVYAWFVWRKGETKEHPIIKWIDNNEYVLRKGE